MSSNRRGGRSPSPGQRPASRTASGKPPAPPPPSVSSSAALPALPGAASKRFDWIDSSLGEDAGGGIKAARPASRAAAGASAAGSGRGSPEFWARSSAPQLLEASVKHPELKLQLLARALEESRAKVAQLQQDKAAVADAILQLCEAAATDGGSGEVGAGTDAALQVAGSPDAAGGSDGDALAQQLDLLNTRLGTLREALAYQTVAAAEAAAAHERAALQLVAQRQQREALERQLEEVRCCCCTVPHRKWVGLASWAAGVVSPYRHSSQPHLHNLGSDCPPPPCAIPTAPLAPTLPIREMTGALRCCPARAGAACCRPQGGAAGGAGGGGSRVCTQAHAGAAGHVSRGRHHCQARLDGSCVVRSSMCRLEVDDRTGNMECLATCLWSAPAWTPVCRHPQHPPSWPAGRCAAVFRSWSSSWMPLARRRQLRQTAAASWRPPASGCRGGSRRRQGSMLSSASSCGEDGLMEF